MCVFEIDELDLGDFPFGRAGGELDHDVVCFYVWVRQRISFSEKDEGWTLFTYHYE